MKTPKKIWKSIAKKFKNSTAAKAKVSSREEANKPLETSVMD
ncbi:hypothetical protein [Wolbachia endosymbiont of Oedothorax gibbosus]|nr:hypothetical protein [Wolbachia endosymbiont of Oedothorax gibbosus]